ncbi:MAG: hypothetical protein SCM96_15250 [Acidobacteriota bacterium]|nr:hypothetical protein [Acidobacteriota bacterium]
MKEHLMLKPSLIIVDDMTERITNILYALMQNNSLGYELTKEEIEEFYKNVTYKCIGKIRDNKIVGINTHGIHINMLEECFNELEAGPAICFLDIDLANNQLDDAAMEKIRDIYDEHTCLSEIHIKEAAATYAGLLFNKGFGRLLVLNSTRGRGRGLVGCFRNRNDYYAALFTSETEDGANKLVKEVFKEYNDRYLLHPSPEIAGVLGLIRRAVYERWDTGVPHPFNHDLLQNKDGKETRHIEEIMRHFDISTELIKSEKEANWSSIKGLFMVSHGNNQIDLSDCRRILSSDILRIVLNNLNMDVELIGDFPWRLPKSPGIALLLALKNLLYVSERQGEEGPSIKIKGEKGDEIFKGKIELKFKRLSNGSFFNIEDYDRYTKNNAERPQYHDLSRAFYDLLRAQVLIENPLANNIGNYIELSAYILGLNTPMKYYQEEIDDCNVVTIEWEAIC